jgi:hypothetical protein
MSPFYLIRPFQRRPKKGPPICPVVVIVQHLRCGDKFRTSRVTPLGPVLRLGNF